jgi:ribosomal-protein-alanine N-acetyltransferase
VWYNLFNGHKLLVISEFGGVIMNFIELESERLLFRKYKIEDYSVFYDMLSNLENMKYRSSEPKNTEEVQRYIDWGIQCAEQTPCINFRYAVVIKETGQLIGSCELAFTDKDPAELAWELHRDYWCKGYGTEIGNTLLKLGFKTLGIRRIIADCNTLNIGSYRIMEKIGMRREAHYVKYYRGNSALNHEWCDKYQYAILGEEYLNSER